VNKTFIQQEELWVHKLDDYTEARFNPQTRTFFLYIHTPLGQNELRELRAFLDEILEWDGWVNNE